MIQQKGSNQALPETAPAAGLSPAALEARRAYQRRYNAANADKRRKWNQAYWERKAQSQTAAVAPDPLEVTED